MLQSQGLFLDGKRLLIQLLCLLTMSLLGMDKRQIIKPRSHIGMCSTYCLFKNTQASFTEYLRLLVFLLFGENLCQRTEASSGIRMRRSHLLLADVQGSLAQLLCL